MTTRPGWRGVPRWSSLNGCWLWRNHLVGKIGGGGAIERGEGG